MKTLLNIIYAKIKQEDYNKEEFQEIITQLEELFFQASKSEGYDPTYKDDMMKQMEHYTINRLHELEQKAKNTDSISLIGEQTRGIAEEIKSFWREKGFQYTSSIQTSPNGVIEVTFGFSLDKSSVFSDKKVSEAKMNKEWKETLIQEGYLLNEKQRELLDCDNNKEKIKQLIQNRFPSAYIKTWKTRIGNKEQQHILSEFTVHIRKLEDIYNKTKTPC